MSRSAADATRFTATGPYVNSKNSSTTTPYSLPNGLKSSGSKTTSKSTSAFESSTISTSGNAQRGETPQEKVQRLRAQARAARLTQSTSTVDRFVESGRRIANHAHKVMVYTLIAASGICGALTIYSVVSLSMYNRRQKALWIDRQLEELQNARLAYTNGTATEAQLEILRNEKIGEIAKQKREEAKEQRLWSRTKRYLLSGLNQEDSASAATTALEASPLLASTDKIGVLDALEAKKMEDAFAKSSSASASASSTSSQQPTSTITTATSSSSPSPSPSLTANAESTKQTSRSWTSWITGR